MNKKIWFILEGVMIMVWVITLIIFLYFVSTDGTRCMANPMVYGVKTLGDKNNDTFTCACTFTKQPLYQIYVDSKHWEIRYIGQEQFYLNPNLLINLNFTKEDK